MEKEYVLDLPAKDLYDVFVESVLTDPFGLDSLVTELDESERFSIEKQRLNSLI